MDKELRKKVRQGAHDACEYCHFPAAFSLVRFEIEYILSRQHAGVSDFENLSYSCANGNRNKGPNIAGLLDGKLPPIPFFHPRLDLRHDHFAWDGVRIIGKTATGEVTIRC